MTAIDAVTQPARRIPDLEVLRGVAICAVVAVHTSWHYSSYIALDRLAGQVLGLVHLASGFGVPLFFALSAAGLSLGYARKLSLAEYLDLLRRRALRLLPAYVTWSLITLALMKPHVLVPRWRLVSALLHGSADAQFYYIPLVFQLYLAWPLLQPLARWSARSRLAAAAVAAFGLALSTSYWQLVGLGWIGPDSGFLLPIFFLYACLGIAVAHHFDALRTLATRSGVLLVADAAAIVALLSFYRRFLAITDATQDRAVVTFAVMIVQLRAVAYAYCAMTALALHATRWTKAAAASTLTWLAANSYGVYLVHFLVLRALSIQPSPMAITKADSDMMLLVKSFSALVSCLFLSAAMTAVVSRSRLLRPLISNRF